MQNELKTNSRYLTRSGTIVTIVGDVTVQRLLDEDKKPAKFSLFEGNNGLLYHSNGDVFDVKNPACMVSVLENDKDITYEIV